MSLPLPPKPTTQRKKGGFRGEGGEGFGGWDKNKTPNS
jgi:hypothetical protein